MRILSDTAVTGLPNVPAFVGIYLVFRIFSDFDLTVQGSIVTGAAVTAVLLLHGVPFAAAIAVAVVAGGVAGVITTAIHVLLRVPVLLAGLVMSLALFSINFQILGQPTVALFGQTTLFSPAANRPGTEGDWITIGICAGVVALNLAVLSLFLHTDLGLALRAAGANNAMARSYGINDYLMLGMALFIANAFTALSGSLLVQSEGYADINMGLGTLIAGIGAVLLGELVLRPSSSQVARIMFTVAVGTLLYQLVLVASLRIGVAPTNLQLVTAVTLVVAVAIRLLVPRGVRLLRPGSAPDLTEPDTGLEGDASTASVTLYASVPDVDDS